MHQSGSRLPSLKGAWNLVYPDPNLDVLEILRNLIGCSGDLELKKTDKSRKNQNPVLVYYHSVSKLQCFVCVFEIQYMKSK